MKDNEDVCKVSGEAPMLMVKACEMFIQELTLHSWLNTEENKRRMVQKKDVAKAIERTELFDFLVDIVHKDEIREEGAGFGPSMLGSTSSDVQNAHPPMGQTAPSEVMIRGTASSGIQNFNPPMGQTAPSEVMIRSTAKPRVYPSVYAQPQAWQVAEDKTIASGESSAQEKPGQLWYQRFDTLHEQLTRQWLSLHVRRLEWKIMFAADQMLDATTIALSYSCYRRSRVQALETASGRNASPMPLLGENCFSCHCIMQPYATTATQAARSSTKLSRLLGTVDARHLTAVEFYFCSPNSEEFVWTFSSYLGSIG
ncbi:Nuclear transcription factor Y subunit C-2 [Capsicum annuum]|nr:Nuclear transcription factor Y subunit C-2 [Capsicum annuum]